MAWLWIGGLTVVFGTALAVFNWRTSEARQTIGGIAGTYAVSAVFALLVCIFALGVMAVFQM